MPDPTLSELMRQYAQEMVNYARGKFRVRLDYSPESVERLEHILDACFQEPDKLRPLGRGSEGASRRESLMDMIDSGERHQARDWLRREEISDGQHQLAVMAGAYVGEIVRRRWGGHWYQAQGARLEAGGQDLNPAGLAYFRLVEGPRHNVAEYFRRVASKMPPEVAAVEQRAQPAWVRDRLEIVTANGCFVLHDLLLEKGSGRNLVISGWVTNRTDRAWNLASFIVKLFDSSGELIPLDRMERNTLRAHEIGQEETRALTAVDRTSPLVLGEFPRQVARFEIVPDMENTREAP